MRIFLLVLLFLAMSACSTVQQVPESSPNATPSPTPHVGGGVTLDNIAPGVIRAIDDVEKSNVLTAFKYVQKVIASKEFDKAVADFKFRKSLMEGKTNADILKIYRTSKQSVNVEMFYGSFMENRVWGTNAYERNLEGFIRINRYFINSPLDIGSTLMHELGHGFGFTHPNLETDSVPYGMNRIYENVANQLGLK